MPTPSPRDPPPLPSRFYSLDVLRGFAALSVVCYHWRHFLLVNGQPDPALLAQQPFYSLLQPLYNEGWRAVDLFFCISGFIFTWLYAGAIHQKKISAWTFSVLRFSRLYPLHAATLLIVLGLQALATHKTGATFVYQINDVKHFVLNVLFASSWGFEKGESFNGPSWSVSVEIALYAVFFVTCFLGVHRWWALLGFLVISVVAYSAKWLPPELSRGLISFFMGCLCFHTFRAVNGLRPPAWALAGLVIACLSTWAVVSMIWYHHALTDVFSTFMREHPGSSVRRLGGIIQSFETHAMFDMVLFPLTVVTLALVESRRGTLGKGIAFVGDVSYSSYLLHFPLQLILFLIGAYAGWSVQVYLRPATFILFFLALVGASLLSFHFFERPMQSFLRKRILGNAKPR